MIKKKSCVGSWYYDIYLETEDIEISDKALNEIKRCIQQNPQELAILQEIFNSESERFEKIELSKIFINLQHKDYVIPFLLDIVNESESPTEDTFERLYAATLLASINHPDGIKGLQRLTKRQTQGELGDFNIYNELDYLISDKTNPYIKDVIKAAAHTYKDARMFYEYFYQEKIDAPEVDA